MTHENLRTGIFLAAAIGLIAFAMLTGKAKSQELETRRMDLQQRLDNLDAKTNPMERDTGSATRKLDNIERAIGEAEKNGRPLDRERINRELRAAERLDSRLHSGNGSANPRIIHLDANGSRIRGAYSGTTWSRSGGFQHHIYGE